MPPATLKIVFDFPAKWRTKEPLRHVPVISIGHVSRVFRGPVRSCLAPLPQERRARAFNPSGPQKWGAAADQPIAVGISLNRRYRRRPSAPV
jgi:hypothetical protein